MTSLDVIGRSHREAPVLRYDPNRDELAALLDGEPRYRLDHVWASPAIAHRVTCEILTEARGWQKASDHVPLIARIAAAPSPAGAAMPG